MAEDIFVPSRTTDLSDWDSDLTTLAGLDASTPGAIASDGAGWVKKTYAQFKTALGLVKADVGLGSVDNTADAAKSVASAAVLTTARTIDGTSFDGSANVTVIAPGTHAAASKATPVDADELPLADSAATFGLKKLTWANLKATLKSYFDGLYLALAGSVGSAAMAGWTVNAQMGTTYTLVLSDAFKIVTLNNAAAVTLTIPGNASVAFPVGTEVVCTGLGAGLVTVAAGAGVTINNPTGASLTLARYMVFRLVKIGTDTWEVNKGSRPPDGATLDINASGQIERMALTGDVTASAGSGATTIAAAAVTNSKMANMAAKTVKMRHTNSTGAPEDATMANLWADIVGQAAANQVTKASPGSNSASASALMVGLAGSITPNGTRVAVWIAGAYTINSTTVSVKLEGRYGTGAAPAFDASSAGTAFGTALTLLETAATTRYIPFTLVGIITGLTAGTAYWLDVAVTGNGTIIPTLKDCTVVAFDV